MISDRVRQHPPGAGAAIALTAALLAGPAAPALAQEPPPLDLAALLAEAEASNPEIALARALRSAGEAVPSQMEAPPDPVASIAYTNETLNEITLGESEDAFLTLSWSQEVPYPGKLRLSGEAARREIEIDRLRLEQVRLDVASRIKRGYADLFRIDRTAAILRESRELLWSFLQTARARYESGEGLLENVLKAQTELTRLDAEIERLAQERRSAEAQLNALVGRAEGSELGRALELPEGPDELDAAGLEREALERSPQVMEREAAVRRDEARLELARRQLKPDLMWGAAYTNRGELDPMVMGMFGLRLPVYRQRRQLQGIVQADRLLEAARHSAASTRLRIASEVRDLAARAAGARNVARLYGEGVIPQARSALESAAASYGVGRVDFLTLLNDLEALLRYQAEYEAQRAERIAALASLESLTARTLVVPAGATGPAQEAQR